MINNKISSLVLFVSMIISLMSVPVAKADTGMLLKSITFSEDMYTLGQTVVGVDTWMKDGTERAQDSAVIAVDPDDPSNRVLKITAAPKSANGAVAPRYRLGVLDKPSNEKLMISFKVKFDKNSTNQFVWLENIGTARVKNDQTGRTQDLFAKWNMFGTGSTLRSRNWYYDANNNLTEEYTETFYPTDGWVQVDEYVDFNDNTIKAIVTDLSTNMQKRIGFDKNHYAIDDVATKYQYLSDIYFNITPSSEAKANAILYVDDIKIGRGIYPKFSASVEAIKLGKASEFSLKFTNPITMNNLGGQVSVCQKNGDPVPAAVVTITSQDATTAIIDISGLDNSSEYILKVNNSFVDCFGQTLPNAFEWPFTTRSEEEENIITKITFSEPEYVLNQTIQGKGPWTASIRPIDSAKVVEYPENSGNRVLALETDNTDMNGQSIVYLNFPNAQIDGKVQISYKMKLVDQKKNDKYLRRWRDKFGLLAGKNTITNKDYPQLYFYSFNASPRFQFHGYTYTPSSGSFGGADAQIGNLDDWLEINERLNMFNNTIKLTATQLDDRGVQLSQTTYGYDGIRYFINDPSMKVNLLTKMSFSLAPPDPNDSTQAELAKDLGKSTLYIDDIVVSLIPSLKATPAFDVNSVDPTKPFAINFTNAVKEDELKKAITIKEADTMETIPNKIDVTMSGNRKTAYISVEGDLKFNATNYVLEINNTFTDSYNEKMDTPFSLSFTTLYSNNTYVNGFKSVTFTNDQGSCTKENATDIRVILDIINPTQDIKSPYVIVAAYNQNNRLLGFKSKSVENIAGGAKAENVQFDISGIPKGTYVIRAFVWNSVTDLKLNHYPYEYK